MQKQTLLLAFILITISSGVFSQNAGNVGIGTTSPTARLQVNASSSGTKPSLLILDSLNGRGPTIKLQRLGLESAFSLTAGFGNTEAGKGIIVSWVDDSILWIKSDGRMGLGTGNPQGRMQINDKSSSGNPSLLIFDSTGGTGNGILFRKQASNREFAIVSDGTNMLYNPKEVGVDKFASWAFLGTGQTGFGTTTPLGKVQLNNNSSAIRPALVLLDSTAGNGNMLAFRKQGSDKQFRMRTDLGGQDLELFSLDYTRGGVTHEDTWSTSGFAMRSNGNIGIGTTTPRGRIQINTKTTASNPAQILIDSAGGIGNMLAFRKQGVNRQFIIKTELGGQDLGLFSINNSIAGPEFTDEWSTAVFTVSGSGNVGIGTGVSEGRLQINHNSTNIQPAMLLMDSSNGAGNMITFRKQGINKQFRINSNLAPLHQDASLAFGVHNDGELYAAIMTMKGDGKVGINNNNPASALDVTGDLNVTGRLRMGGAPGAAGQVLTSNGPAQAPSWQPASVPVGFNSASNTFNVAAAAIIIPAFSVERFDLMGNFNPETGEFLAPVLSQYALNAHVAFTTPPAGNLPQYTIKVVIETLNGDNSPVQALEQALPLPLNMPSQTIHVSLHSIQRLQAGQKVRLKVLHTRPDGPVQAKVEEFSASKI